MHRFLDIFTAEESHQSSDDVNPKAIGVLNASNLISGNAQIASQDALFSSIWMSILGMKGALEVQRTGIETQSTLSLTKFNRYRRPSRSLQSRTTSVRMANIETPIPILKLNDGTPVPMLAYGTGTAWYRSSGSTSIDRPTVDALKTALKLGYNHLDAAETYGNEAEVGIAIKESKVSRDKLFVTTKVSQSIGDISKAIDASLKKLQLDYVDLFLIHQPFFAESNADLEKAWKDMEAVKASGKAKSIGVSNYLIPQLEATLKVATAPPTLNQIEFHPYLQHGSLLDFHKKHNIATAAYGPLTAATKAKPGPLDGILAELARKYFVSENEVLLRWALDQGVVAVTTSGKEQRLSDYLRAMTFSLTPREVNDISTKGAEKHFRGFWSKKFAEGDRS